jgi:hypothetical protein
MKTSCLTINEAQVAAILPGLEAMMNAIGDARLGHFPRLDPRVQFSGSNGSSVYSQAESDETMAGHILTARNKLKWLNPSHKVRLNSFELAAAAFALRLVKREALAPEDVLAKVPGLADKLEKYRRRAKRAAIKEIGLVAYKEQAERWNRFLQWMHCILCYRPTLWKSSALRLIHRDRREKLLELATEVAPTANPAQLRHVVGLAKRELLRGRHPETLGLVVSDDARGREFMARFIGKRMDPEILAPEFQSLDVRQAACGERLKKALVIDEPDEPVHEVQVAATTGEEHRDTAGVPVPSAYSSSDAPADFLAPTANPESIPTQDELTLLYTRWLAREFDPGDWDSITKQTQLEIWRPYREPKRATAANTAVSNDPEIRPDYFGADAFEANNLYAMWGARWLTTKNPNPNAAIEATIEGFRLVDAWERMSYGTQKSKLDAIYLRNRP